MIGIGIMITEFTSCKFEFTQQSGDNYTELGCRTTTVHKVE